MSVVDHAMATRHLLPTGGRLDRHDPLWRRRPPTDFDTLQVRPSRVYTLQPARDHEALRSHHRPLPQRAAAEPLQIRRLAHAAHVPNLQPAADAADPDPEPHRAPERHGQ